MRGRTAVEGTLSVTLSVTPSTPAHVYTEAHGYYRTNMNTTDAPDKKDTHLNTTLHVHSKRSKNNKQKQQIDKEKESFSYLVSSCICVLTTHIGLVIVVVAKPMAEM